MSQTPSTPIGPEVSHRESNYSATEFTANSHDDTTSSLALHSAEVSMFTKNFD